MYVHEMVLISNTDKVMHGFRVFIIMITVLTVYPYSLQGAQASNPTSIDSSLIFYKKANLLFKKHDYGQSLHFFEKVVKLGTLNPNISFKIGVCVYHLSNDHVKSLKYFKKAKEEVKNKVSFYDLDETAAPFETYYYLAKLYHLIYDTESSVDHAMEYLKYYNFSTNTEAISLKEADSFKADIDDLLSKNYYLDKCILNPIEIELSKIDKNENRENTFLSHLKYFKLNVDEVLVYNHDSIKARSIKYIKLRNFESGDFVIKEINGGTSSKDYRIIGSNSLNTMAILENNNFLYLAKVDPPFLHIKNEIKIAASFGKIISATINSDNSKLIFEAYNSKSVGGSDLFFSASTNEGLAFETFKNLGYAVNSHNSETNPSFTGNTDFITFSSEGHNSIGGQDIFIAKLEQNNTIEQITNLGFPLNSTSDESDYVILANGSSVILSNRNIFNQQLFFITPKEKTKNNVLTYILEHLSQIKKKTKETMVSQVTDSKANDKSILEEKALLNPTDTLGNTKLMFTGQKIGLDKENDKESINLSELTAFPK